MIHHLSAQCNRIVSMWLILSQNTLSCHDASCAIASQCELCGFWYPMLIDQIDPGPSSFFSSTSDEWTHTSWFSEIWDDRHYLLYLTFSPLHNYFPTFPPLDSSHVSSLVHLQLSFYVEVPPQLLFDASFLAVWRVYVSCLERGLRHGPDWWLPCTIFLFYIFAGEDEWLNRLKLPLFWVVADGGAGANGETRMWHTMNVRFVSPTWLGIYGNEGKSCPFDAHTQYKLTLVETEIPPSK